MMLATARAHYAICEAILAAADAGTAVQRLPTGPAWPQPCFCHCLRRSLKPSTRLVGAVLGAQVNLWARGIREGLMRTKSPQGSAPIQLSPR